MLQYKLMTESGMKLIWAYDMIQVIMQQIRNVLAE